MHRRAGPRRVRPRWSGGLIQRVAGPALNHALTPGTEDGFLRKATICDDFDGYPQQRAAQVVTRLAQQVESVS